MRLDATLLRQAWQKRQPREQWILCAAALIVPLLLADTLVWNPWRVQMKALNARATQSARERQQLADAAASATQNDAPALRDLDTLRARLAQAEQATQRARQSVVSPAQMAARLRAITQSRGAVNVVALRSLPVTPVLDAGPGRLYRHSFELQVEGGYAEIARYIESLEQTAGVLHWSAVELDASRHPTIAARLEVFTLSEQSSWIQL